MDRGFPGINRMSFDKREFIEAIRPNIEKTVAYFISRRLFHYSERSDIEQALSLYMLENADKIIAKFEGRSKFSTYLISILFNYCISFSLSMKKSFTTDTNLDYKQSVPPEQYHEQLFLSEYNRLSNLIELLHEKKYKLILCLKLIYKLPLEKADFSNCFPGIMDNDISEILSLSHIRRVNLTEKEIYAKLTPVLNKYEKKENSPDAVRKWVDLKIKELVSELNGYPAHAAYNPKIFQILFEKYCMKRK